MEHDDEKKIEWDDETLWKYQAKTKEKWVELIMPAYRLDSSGKMNIDIGATAIDEYLRKGYY